MIHFRTFSPQRQSFFARMHFSFLSTLILKTVFTSGVTVGPRGTLTLSNVDISPDGHLRTSGKQFFPSSPCWYHFSRASLVNGVHPGPVITMSKVIPAWLLVWFLILVETRISGWVAWDECRKSIVKWGHDCWDVYCKCNPLFFRDQRGFSVWFIALAWNISTSHQFYGWHGGCHPVSHCARKLIYV